MEQFKRDLLSQWKESRTMSGTGIIQSNFLIVLVKTTKINLHFFVGITVLMQVGFTF